MENKPTILVVDMLKGFCTEGHPLYTPEAAMIIPNIKDLLSEKGTMYGSWFYDNIIYVCDQHEIDDIEFELFPPHCIINTKETEVIDDFEYFKGRRVNKTRYSGFYNTKLDAELQIFNAKDLIICGVCTDICILYTAADAVFRGYNVSIPMNCVASFDYEGHKFALNLMKNTLGVKLI